MKLEWLMYCTVFMMVVASAGALMFVAHSVQKNERKIYEYEQAIAVEKEKIILLEAEWAFLNNPERLEKLTLSYLDLTPPPPERLVSNVNALMPVFEEEILASSSHIQEVSYQPTEIVQIITSSKPSMNKKKEVAR